MMTSSRQASFACVAIATTAVAGDMMLPAHDFDSAYARSGAISPPLTAAEQGPPGDGAAPA